MSRIRADAPRGLPRPADILAFGAAAGTTATTGVDDGVVMNSSDYSILASEEARRSFFEALPAAIVVVDAAARIRAGNAAWRRLAADCGIAGDDYLVAAAALDRAVPPDTPACTTQLREVLAGGRDVAAGVYACATTGGSRRLHVHIAALAGADGRGAVVSHFDLAAAAAPDGAPRQAALTDRSLHAAGQRTLLLVDDEENILASLKRLLRRDGYRILTAESGAAALELLAQNAVDVIVSDQRMPNMTGVEFLRRVKTLYPATVRIVLSGYTELQSITDAINEGAIYKFLTKPWDDELLRANIEEAFRHKEMGDENLRLGRELEAANRELAAANAQLTALLRDQQRALALGGASLEVAREILAEVPLPVIGVDEDGLIVFANPAAETLLAGEEPLLGADAATHLPEALFRLLPPAAAADAEATIGGRSCRVLCRAMSGRASGRLLLILPKGEC
ncbi:response regulator [Azospira restricta]|uniref:Response regulator n=1 Tax=Azospira restricta TaxID=404405 RepID=A0A974SSH9_9RHOO|nr:response regulator [Azospira restricta]QRJ65518.1 response regulator [Azospira restricta]